jgi:hypothetical protein
LAIQKHISLQLMDVVTAYLYGSLDSNIYMKVSNGISVSIMNANHNIYCVNLVKSLYGLKQLGRIWYNRLKEFLLKKGYSNSDDCPCVFIIGHAKVIDEAHNHLKREFEMKDLGKTKLYLVLQI